VWINFLSKFKSYKLYLIIAVLLGVFVRFYGLDIQGLWFDELVIIFPAVNKNLNMLQLLLLNDLHPPLYPLFLYSWITTFGNSEILIRLPSAIAGVLAIVFMYLFSKNIFNKYIATSSTILIALSSAAIVYSQEARNYSFVLLFSTISTLYWLDLLKKIKNSQIKKKEFIIYWFVCVFMSYLHYFGAAFIFFQLVYLLIVSLQAKKHIKEMLFFILMFACTFLPWLFTQYSYIKVVNSEQFWISKPDITSISLLLDFIFNKKLIIFLLIPILISVIKKELFIEIKQTNLRSPIIALLYLALFPVLVIFLISQTVPVFYPRYFIVILSPVYLLIPILISLNSFFIGIKNTIYIFIISLASFLLFLFVPGNNILDNNKTFYQPYKQQWREASKYVMDNYAENTAIFVDRHPFMYSYYFDKFQKYQGKINIIEYKFSITEDNLYEISKKFDTVFFFSTFSNISENMKSSLKKACNEHKENDFTGIFVHKCSLNKSQKP